MLEKDYPYKAKDEHCKFDAKKVAARTSGLVTVPPM
jgi:hypothetical protein